MHWRTRTVAFKIHREHVTDIKALRQRTLRSDCQYSTDLLIHNWFDFVAFASSYDGHVFFFCSCVDALLRVTQRCAS